MDISYFNLIIGFSILAIPILIFLYYKVGLIKSTLISVGRMTLQLFFVALYLEYIFEWNNAWINSLWVIVMVVVAALTSVNHSDLKLKHLLVPILFSGLISIVVIDAFFIGVVIQLDYIFEARYFIPISGMILGNILKYNIVGLNSYFTSISKDQNLYYFLMIHNSKSKAVLPFIRIAMRKALNPYIATMSVIGLIALPGMMTGQILGGSSPAVAIKYQLMIALYIFVACVLNLFLSLFIANKYVFDEMGRLKKDVIKKKTQKQA
jgi:putative ABC transport system permease protein